jgi:hypothetical protein
VQNLPPIPQYLLFFTTPGGALSEVEGLEVPRLSGFVKAVACYKQFIGYRHDTKEYKGSKKRSPVL